ncbi:MAG TPA: hypothetical protein VGK48_18635 [Terriglobia bacterium]|jgi:hypothetical protein
METHPPKLIEALVERLVPPACRENVMGDWDEKYTSPAGYILRVVSDLPFVVASQIRRTFHAALFFSQAAALYIAFAGSSLLVPRYLYDDSRLLPLTIVIGAVLFALVCRDAYANREEHPDDRARRDPVFAIGTGLICELLLFVLGGSSLVLPFWILIAGSAAGLLMVYMLRRFIHSSPQDSPATAGGPQTSLDEHRKAWRWNLLWLIAGLLIIFTLPSIGNNNGGSVLDAVFLVIVVFHLFRRNKDGFTGASQEYSVLSIADDPYINQLKRKRDGLEFWAGAFARGGGGILILAIIGFHFVPLVAGRIGGLPLPANVSGTHISLSLIAFGILTASWIFVRSRNLRAARAIQDELDRLNTKDKNQ